MGVFTQPSLERVLCQLLYPLPSHPLLSPMCRTCHNPSLTCTNTKHARVQIMTHHSERRWYNKMMLMKRHDIVTYGILNLYFLVNTSVFACSFADWQQQADLFRKNIFVQQLQQQFVQVNLAHIDSMQQQQKKNPNKNSNCIKIISKQIDKMRHY